MNAPLMHANNTRTSPRTRRFQIPDSPARLDKSELTKLAKSYFSFSNRNIKVREGRRRVWEGERERERGGEGGDI